MSERVEGKIALEEHFYLPSFETFGADGSALDGAGKAQNYLPDFFASVQKRLGDDKLRLEEMDRCGIELMILSLTQPGIQGIADSTIKRTTPAAWVSFTITSRRRLSVRQPCCQALWDVSRRTRSSDRPPGVSPAAARNASTSSLHTSTPRGPNSAWPGGVPGRSPPPVNAG